MSKAVLVMDMPYSCFIFNFLYCNAECNMESCQAMEVPRLVDLEKEDKPDWCPLRPVPDKKDMKYMDDKSEYFRQGWNACIDAIGGGESDNK